MREVCSVDNNLVVLSCQSRDLLDVLQYSNHVFAPGQLNHNMKYAGNTLKNSKRIFKSNIFPTNPYKEFINDSFPELVILFGERQLRSVQSVVKYLNK